MKKLDTPEIGDPSVNGSGGVNADGAGARCFAPTPAVEEPSVPPVVSVCPPPAEPFDFVCARWVPGVLVAPAAGVLPCSCWPCTCGVVVSAGGALPLDGVGAGAGMGSVVVVVAVDGAVVGASGAGVTGAVSVALADSVEVVPVDVGCDDDDDVGSPALAAAGANASTPSTTSSGRISGRALIGSTLE